MPARLHVLTQKLMNLAQVYVADIFPGALNVPWTELVREGELKTTDELDAIFLVAVSATTNQLSSAAVLV